MLPVDSELAYATADAVNAVTPALQEYLTSLATSSGWPAYIVESLSVQYDGENLILTYPPELESEIDNLEYGTLNTVPNAVIRPFILRSGSILENVLSATVLDDLIDMEEVF